MIDLLNIDTENMDFDVLKSNDWARWKPKVIVVESHGFEVGAPQKNDIYRYLISISSQLPAFLGFSLIFVLAENH